jgi:hypothetical protein
MYKTIVIFEELRLSDQPLKKHLQHARVPKIIRDNNYGISGQSESGETLYSDET